jgi:hypothetical protein
VGEKNGEIKWVSWRVGDLVNQQKETADLEEIQRRR